MVTVLLFSNVSDQVRAIGNALLLDLSFSALAAHWNHLGSFQNCWCLGLTDLLGRRLRELKDPPKWFWCAAKGENYGLPENNGDQFLPVKNKSWRFLKPITAITKYVCFQTPGSKAEWLRAQSLETGCLTLTTSFVTRWLSTAQFIYLTCAPVCSFVKWAHISTHTWQDRMVGIQSVDIYRMLTTMSMTQNMPQKCLLNKTLNQFL